MHRYALALPFCVVVSGCGEEVTHIPQGEYPNDTGLTDTGFVQYDVGPGMLEPGECLTNGKDGPGGTAFGYMYRCNGGLSASVEYIYDGAPYNIIFGLSAGQSSQFGEGHDTYWWPKVMACCGEYDDNLSFEDQPEFALSCLMDAREGVCWGAYYALSDQQYDLPNGAHKNAVEEMRIYVLSHLTECLAGLGTDFPTTPTGHYDQWSLPTNWQSEDLTGAQVSYIASIESVTWPEYDYPNNMYTCESLHENDHSAPTPLPRPAHVCYIHGIGGSRWRFVRADIRGRTRRCRRLLRLHSDVMHRPLLIRLRLRKLHLWVVYRRDDAVR